MLQKFAMAFEIATMTLMNSSAVLKTIQFFMYFVRMFEIFFLETTSAVPTVPPDCKYSITGEDFADSASHYFADEIVAELRYYDAPELSKPKSSLIFSFPSDATFKGIDAQTKSGMFLTVTAFNFGKEPIESPLVKNKYSSVKKISRLNYEIFNKQIPPIPSETLKPSSLLFEEPLTGVREISITNSHGREIEISDIISLTVFACTERECSKPQMI